MRAQAIGYLLAAEAVCKQQHRRHIRISRVELKLLFAPAGVDGECAKGLAFGREVRRRHVNSRVVVITAYLGCGESRRGVVVIQRCHGGFFRAYVVQVLKPAERRDFLTLQQGKEVVVAESPCFHVNECGAVYQLRAHSKEIHVVNVFFPVLSCRDVLFLELHFHVGDKPVADVQRDQARHVQNLNVAVGVRVKIFVVNLVSVNPYDDMHARFIGQEG